jgi:hypothetical protein
MKMKILHLLILSGLIPIFIIGMNEAHAQHGCPPVSGGWDPVISTDQNNVYVFWNYFFGCGQRVLLFEKSNDNGITFTGPVTLENSTQSGSSPVVVASNGDVYVSWINYHSPDRLYFKMSGDGGSSFGDPVQVSMNGTIQSDVYDILASGNNIGIIWAGQITNQTTRSVFLSESTDEGRTFGDTKVLSTTGDSFQPQAVQVGSKAYVLWSSFGNCSGKQDCMLHVYFTTIDIQNEFATSSITSLGPLSVPRLAVSGNNVYVAGATSTNADPSIGNSGVSFVKSTDGGVLFEKPVQLVTYVASSNYLNDLALDSSGDHVYVTWHDHDPHSGEKLLMAASSDDGNTFGNMQTLDGPDLSYNGNEPYSLDKQVSTSGSNYSIIWQSHTSLGLGVGEGIFFRKSIDGGQTLGNATDLTNRIVISNPGYAIASSGNNLYIAGPDYGFQDGNHIVFSQSPDGGISFSNSTDFDQNSMSTVPEFPFTVPVLLIGIVSVIAFYRVKFRK